MNKSLIILIFITIIANLFFSACSRNCHYHYEPSIVVYFIDPLMLDTITDDQGSHYFLDTDVHDIKEAIIDTVFNIAHVGGIDITADIITSNPGQNIYLLPVDMNGSELQYVFLNSFGADTLCISYGCEKYFQHTDCGYVVELKDIEMLSNSSFQLVEHNLPDKDPLSLWKVSPELSGENRLYELYITFK